MKLDHCRIVITGASSGIGLELLKQLQQYDVQILAAARNVSNIKGVENKVVPFSCDVSKPENVDLLFEKALEVMGGVDLFIANAGFAYYEKLAEADWQHIERIFHTNVFSPFYSLEKLRLMNPNRNFKMVITASGMSKLSLPGYSLYSSTKSALDAFADAYRFELDAPHQLTLVYPIATATNFFEVAAADAPVPWPTQTAAHVAKTIIRGIEIDQPSIYPSGLFRLMMGLNRFLFFVFPLYQKMELKKLKKFLSSRIKS